MRSEQTCKNCGHFVRHYLFDARAGFVPLDTGHCLVRRVREKEIGRLFTCGGCPQWEESARPVQRRAEIADILRGMEKHLSHIAAWLNGGEG